MLSIFGAQDIIILDNVSIGAFLFMLIFSLSWLFHMDNKDIW